MYPSSVLFLVTSFLDPLHFGISESIFLRIRVLLFTSVAFKMKKIMYVPDFLLCRYCLFTSVFLFKRKDFLVS
jgi:hypothetical protein